MTDQQAKQVLTQMLEWNAQENSTFCGVLGNQMTDAVKHSITLIDEKAHVLKSPVSAYDYKVRCDFLESELARVRELLATQLR